jgi:uncharacterized membrane protein YkvA (DUF1232 family)
MDSTKWLLLGLLAAVALVTVVIAVRLLIKLVRSRKLLKDSGVPMSTKTMFWASIVYLVWPVDLLPDPIYLDDIGFLMLALRSLHAAANRAGVLRAGSQEAAPRAPEGKLGKLRK